MGTLVPTLFLIQGLAVVSGLTVSMGFGVTGSRPGESGPVLAFSFGILALSSVLVLVDRFSRVGLSEGRLLPLALGAALAIGLIATYGLGGFGPTLPEAVVLGGMAVVVALAAKRDLRHSAELLHRPLKVAAFLLPIMIGLQLFAVVVGLVGPQRETYGAAALVAWAFDIATLLVLARYMRRSFWLKMAAPI